MISAIQEYIRKDTETLEAPSKQTLYYLERFKRLDQKPGALSWNWGAAFFSVCWMLYRRMYWQGALTFGAFILIVVLFRHFLSVGTASAISFGLLGFLGNSLYYAHVKHQLQKGRTRSGVDTIGPTLLIFFYIIAFSLALIF